MEPVPPEPPERKPPRVDCAVDGYIQSAWPAAHAACSSSTMGVPASAVMNPSPTSTIALARVVSMTRPPCIGMAWP